MVTVTVNGRFTLTLPRHRADRPEWYTESGWEKPRMTALVKRIMELPGYPVVYYVGAEEGDLAAICAMHGANTYLFEPNPKAWPNIRAIWEANELDTPVTYAGFASDVTRPLGTDTLGIGWPPCSTMEIVGNHGFKELYQEADMYSQIQLDDVALQLDPPSIITFDVEGSEWQVLRGAENVLRHYRPTLFASIHPEFMFHQWGEYSRDLRDWIIDIGYQETILDYQHELHTMYTPR